MSNRDMFTRKTLDEITQIPVNIISVYVVENHIWADGGSQAARAARQVELRTVEEFLIDPVRSFLNDIFRQMSAPYRPERKDVPIGQGYWIQAEFGSGKSHLLSFVGALALGVEAAWDIVREKERKAGMGRRESLYNFYENGLAKKAGSEEREKGETRGIFVAVKTLVGEGGGTIGISGARKGLTEYVLDAVAEQFYLETGRSLPLYPTQILAERFLQTEDFERYRRDLAKYLQDPAYFDEEEREEVQDFLDDLRNNLDPGVQRDCGQRLWEFYERYLKIRPQIPMETEAVLKHMVQRLLDEGYAGLLLILDEVSLFMKGRDDAQRVEDEKALVVLSNRLARVENLPVWTVCAAQQAIESKMAGIKNIIARERLDLVPLLNNPDNYYDIALARVREVTDAHAVDEYYEDYKRSFSWPQAVGKDRFAHFFPFYPPSIDVIRALSYRLTTVRSALYFMLQTLKTQRKRHSHELITLWSLFDDVVEYEEDPSGTTRSIASIKTKWPEEWKAYEAATRQLDRAVKGPLKVYRSRCEKLIKTLFLYHIADLAPGGLKHEELMNSVMEWKDHVTGQQADLRDNQDHYEVLADQVALELVQVDKVGAAYRFKPEGGTVDPLVHFQRARAEAEQNEVTQRQAWEALLGLDGWEITTGLMRLDLAAGVHSIFRDIAPSTQQEIILVWHGREITGRVLMRDLLDIGKRDALLPSVNSSETGLDFMVFISATPAAGELDGLVAAKRDPRVLFWSPGPLTTTERSLLLDFAAYRALVADYRGQDTEDARVILEWVQNRLRDQIGTIYRSVTDSYARGRVAALDHSQLDFKVQGELSAILEPLVGQLLDTVYVSRGIDFEAPAPFNDTNAVNVINGVVKTGEIPRGAKPTRDTSAAKNYGFALQIMHPPDNHRLNLRDCRYTRDMLAWIEDKLSDSEAAMSVRTVYKNFMGMNGPNSVHYGLSRRMVQLYLLCLVREGKIRISLTGRSAPVEVLDYTNIATVDFKVAVLEAFDQVQRLKPPEGWAALAPFAAVLLDDPTLQRTQQDADIQEGVRRLLVFKETALPVFQSLHAGFRELLQEIYDEEGEGEKGEDSPFSPLLNRLEQWAAFLSAPIEPASPLPYLRHALDKAFGYHVYQEERVRSEEVDDLASRKAEVAQVACVYGYRERLRRVAHYVRWEEGERVKREKGEKGAAEDWRREPVLGEVLAALQRAGMLLADLGALVESETRLVNDVLEPAEAAMESYATRYLQVFDHMTQHTAQVQQAIGALRVAPAFYALGHLARVPQLGADLRPGIERAFRAALAGPPALFPTDLARATVQQGLRAWPQPPQCPLTLQNAGAWLQRADDALARAQTALQQALLEKTKLLHSDTLRERLAQGQDAGFIAALLAAPTVDALADVLTQSLGTASLPDPDPVALLARYLKKLRVYKVRLADFTPSKRTLERGDVDAVVAEFRTFLLDALHVDDEDQLPVIELEGG